MRRWAPLFTLLVLGCAGSSPPAPAASPLAGASAKPSASASPAPSRAPTPSPSAAASPSPPVASVPGATTFRCATVPGASSLLVLGKLAGSDDVVLRDITDLNNPVTDCTFQGTTGPRLVSATKIAYTRIESAQGRILVADLSSGATSQAVGPFAAGGYGAATYAFSADAQNLSYIANDGTSLTWHLLRGTADSVLATYASTGGRGVNADQDDFFLGFSADGRFVALEQTFYQGGGELLHLVVRNVADGSVAFSAADATMAAWAGSGSTLLYRSTDGTAWKWTGTMPLRINQSLKWIRPKASPDGRLLVFSIRQDLDIAAVYTMDIGTGAVLKVSPDGRDGPAFLSTNLTWYWGERVCGPGDHCLGPAYVRTGLTYVNDVNGASESASRLTEVDDIWPHLASGRGT